MGQAHSTTADKKRSAKFYALRIKDCPGWPSGTPVIAQQGAWKEIEDGDQVLYHDHQGLAHIGIIKFTENNINFTFGRLTSQTTVLPREEIKRFEPIIGIAAREEIGESFLRDIRQRQRLKKYVEGIAR